MKRLFGKLGLKLFGWKKGEDPPKMDKYVMIAAPHTSNWDFYFMMFITFQFDMKISWMGKKALFYWPWGWFFRALGGVAIDRKSKHNVVQQMVNEFEKVDKLILVIPAAGTRSYRDYWKSGFYHIAKEANLPLVPGYLDFGRKQGGFGPPLIPSDDISADMDILREFYRDIKGKNVENTSRLRLRGEDEEPTKAIEEPRQK